MGSIEFGMLIRPRNPDSFNSLPDFRAQQSPAHSTCTLWFPPAVNTVEFLRCHYSCCGTSRGSPTTTEPSGPSPLPALQFPVGLDTKQLRTYFTVEFIHSVSYAIWQARRHPYPSQVLPLPASERRRTHVSHRVAVMCRLSLLGRGVQTVQNG